MTTCYTQPTLLIEFDENKPFSILGSGESLSDDIEFKNTMSKITLLTLTFPTLRLLWTQSPYTTAELFYLLKQHQPEPDVHQAIQAGEDVANNDDDYAMEPMLFLRSMPGVTSQNIYLIMEKIKSLVELSSMSLGDIQQVAGKSNGQLLFEFLHNEQYN